MSEGATSDPASKSDSHFSLRHIITQASWAGAFEIVGIGVRYLLVLVIARLYGAAGLGLYTLAFAFASGAALLGRLGLDRAALRFTAHYRAQQRPSGAVGVNVFAMTVVLLLSMAMAMAMFIGSGAIAALWGQPDLSEGLRIVATAIPAIALGEVWRSGLRGFQDVRLAAFLEKVAIPGGGAALILLLTVARPANVFAPLVASSASYWLASLVAGLYLRRSIRDLGGRPAFDVWPWLTFAVFLSLEGGLLYLLQWTDQLLVGLFLSTDDVGIYAASVRVGALAAVPLLAVNTILAPTIAGLHARGERNVLRETYARLTWATAVSGIAIGLTLVAFGQVILGLFGSEFAPGYTALVIVTVGQTVNSFTGSSGVMLGMTGHVRWRLLNAILAAGLNVCLNWVLIPTYGIAGSAAATAASLIVINLLQVAEVRLVLGFWGYDRQQLGYWLRQVRSARPPTIRHR